MRRVLVLGGRGYLGSRIVASLRRGETKVVVGSRRPGPDGVALDLGNPEDWGALRGFDVIVNATDALVVDPWPAMVYCLEHGLVWVETSSEPLLMRRALEQPRDASWSGTVILGAGIFTGLSNMMGARAVEGLEGASLDLGIRWMPLSGGGGGMVGLMTHLLNVPTAYVEGGALEHTRAITRGPALPYEDGEHTGLHISFAEPTMLHHSTKARDIRVYASFIPGLLMYAFLWTPAFLLRMRLVQWVMGLGMGLLRRVVLRSVESAVRMVARARSQGEGRTITLFASDGMGLGADVVTSVVSLLEAPPAGVHTIDQCLDWEALRIALKRDARTSWKLEESAT